jgi:hypothetical protein
VQEVPPAWAKVKVSRWTWWFWQGCLHTTLAPMRFNTSGSAVASHDGKLLPSGFQQAHITRSGFDAFKTEVKMPSA